MNLSFAPLKHKLSFNATNITHFHSRPTFFIVKQYRLGLALKSVMMMKNKDRKAILSSAYHEFSIHRRLFWLVLFLRFAIPCCDFPHDELSWRRSWHDDLNLEVIQQLYILTASFAPEHGINIQWNQICQHDRRHLLFSRVWNEIQGISNRIVRMRDISLLCCVQQESDIAAFNTW